MVLHLSPFFLGSRYQRDIPGKQEGGWPGEDIHHVQQRQGLAPPASSRCGPERQSSTLPAGQCPCLMWGHRADCLPGGAPSGALFYQRGLRNVPGAGQAFPTTPRALICGLRLPYHLDGKFSWIPQAFTENILCATTSSKRKEHNRKPAPKGPRQSSVVVNTY